MKVKRRYYIYGFFILILVVYYFVDREFFMKKRVTRHEMWDYEDGYHYKKDGEMRDMIYTNLITSFKGDTMIFSHRGKNYDTLILKWEYFGTMKVLDPNTGKTAEFGMKGANWIDYLFDK